MRVRRAQSAKLLLLSALVFAAGCTVLLPALANDKSKRAAREGDPGTRESGEQLAEHQRLAREAEQRQDFVTAIREYKVLTAAVPGSAELRSNLGVAYYFNHDFALADAAFRRALALKPNLYTPHLFIGMSLVQQRRSDAAVLELEKAVALNAADPVAHTWLGYAYTMQARFDKAADAFETAAQLNPGDPDVWFALGRCNMELGKAATMRLIGQKPDSGRVWQLAAEQYEARGNSGKALKLYTAALERRPDLAEVRERVQVLGGSIPAAKPGPQRDVHEEDALYAGVKEFEKKAREAFEQVSRIDPDGYRAHQVLGDAAAAADLDDEAVREYTAVLRRKPDLPGIHRALCTAYSHLARVQDAIRECEAELKLSPANADVYAEAARVSLLADDNDRAQVLLEKAVTLDRPPAEVYKLLGKLYVRQEKYQKASEAFAKYVAAEPRDATAYYLLGRACKSAGDTAGANRAFAEYQRRSSIVHITTEAEQALSTRRDEPDDADAQKGNKPL